MLLFLISLVVVVWLCVLLVGFLLSCNISFLFSYIVFIFVNHCKSVKTRFLVAVVSLLRCFFFFAWSVPFISRYSWLFTSCCMNHITAAAPEGNTKHTTSCALVDFSSYWEGPTVIDSSSLTDRCIGWWSHAKESVKFNTM